MQVRACAVEYNCIVYVEYPFYASVTKSIRRFEYDVSYWIFRCAGDPTTARQHPRGSVPVDVLVNPVPHTTSRIPLIARSPDDDRAPADSAITAVLITVGRA